MRNKINGIPNYLFIAYLLISYPLYCLTEAPDNNGFYYFFLFQVRYIGFSCVPLFFIIAYNFYKKEIIGLISSILSIVFILIIILGYYGETRAQEEAKQKAEKIIFASNLNQIQSIVLAHATPDEIQRLVSQGLIPMITPSNLNYYTNGAIGWTYGDNDKVCFVYSEDMRRIEYGVYERFVQTDTEKQFLKKLWINALQILSNSHEDIDDCIFFEHNDCVVTVKEKNNNTLMLIVMCQKS